jgi:NAD(P)H-flavin reductase
LPTTRIWKPWWSPHPDTILYVPTVSWSQEKKHTWWAEAAGMMDLIVEEYLEKFDLSSGSTLVYACGHPGMVEDLNGQLISRASK